MQTYVQDFICHKYKDQNEHYKHYFNKMNITLDHYEADCFFSA